MHNKKHIIAIVSPSQVIQLGLSAIVRENSGIYQLQNFNDLYSLQNFLLVNDASVVVIDAGIITFNQKLIISLRKEYSAASWIAIVYQYVNPSVIGQFDDSITIDQGADDIMSVINASLGTEKEHHEEVKTENLSDRETDVLKLLVTGYSAKEIAERLNISVNTVISHRKNISQKTGIKSLAGLTIYAVTNKVISMSNLQR